MHKLIQILFACGTITLVVLIMAETNYNACKRAINQTERKHADIIGILKVYGFDPQGNPMYEPTTEEKIRASFYFNNQNK